MRSSSVARKLKQVGKADSLKANLGTTRLRNGSDAGFLLLDAALKPLYVNAEAGWILFHPEKTPKAKDFSRPPSPKIRTISASGAARGQASLKRGGSFGREDVRLPIL